MSRRLIITGLLALFTYQPALAFEARELSQEEIRKAVASTDSLSPRRILDTVSKRVAGEIVDVRVFDAGGLCYRILLVLPTGKLASVVVDAATGNLLAGNSQRASSVTVAAQSNPDRNGKISGKKGSTGSRSGNTNSNSGGNNDGSGNNGGRNGNGGGNNGDGGGNSGGNGKK